MIFHLPFVYEAIIKKTPKGKEIYVVVEDSVQLLVKNVSRNECQPAIQADGSTLLWDGENLLKPFNAIVGNDVNVAIYSADIQMNASRAAMANPSSEAKALYPFLRYFNYDVPNMDNSSRLKAIKKAINLGTAAAKKDIQHHEWICDSREEAIAKLKENADNLALVDDIIHTKTPEPVYSVRCSCAGELPAYCIVTTTYNHKIVAPNTVLFNINSRKEMEAYSKEEAKSLGVNVNSKFLRDGKTHPQVLLNEAILMPIKTVRDC